MKNVEKINKILPNNARYISENAANKILKDKYQQQAVDFLLETKTTCEIVFKGLSKTSWSGMREVNRYEVTLKNDKSSYTFEFFDSIKNTENNKKATFDFYSVLTCLSLNYSRDFDDFCSEYGYSFKTEKEFIKVKQAYFAVCEQDEALRKLFNEDELIKLSDIN